MFKNIYEFDCAGDANTMPGGLLIVDYTNEASVTVTTRRCRTTSATLGWFDASTVTLPVGRATDEFLHEILQNARWLRQE